MFTTELGGKEHVEEARVRSSTADGIEHWLRDGGIRWRTRRSVAHTVGKSRSSTKNGGERLAVARAERDSSSMGLVEFRDHLFRCIAGSMDALAE